jgi:CubicO group peptidase (beta-lactamase class C family)
MTAASFTKAAFAYMVMQLVDDGVSQLDRPVHCYLPRPLPNTQAMKASRATCAMND